MVPDPDDINQTRIRASPTATSNPRTGDQSVDTDIGIGHPTLSAYISNTLKKNPEEIHANTVDSIQTGQKRLHFGHIF